MAYQGKMAPAYVGGDSFSRSSSLRGIRYVPPGSRVDFTRPSLTQRNTVPWDTPKTSATSRALTNSEDLDDIASMTLLLRC
jgi:hypothetical protein